MRILALAMSLTTLVAHAETGPPTAEEFARAKAVCAAEVRQGCLFTLALVAALEEERPRELPWVLNQVAAAQAKAGDVAGAERTLTLTEADESTLLALGRWDEAYTVAERQFPNLAVEQGTAEGSFKITMVRQMLVVGELDLALTTALSISDGWGERDRALFLIFEKHLSNRDFAGAVAAYDLMQDRDSPHRGRALLALAEAYATAGQTAEVTALLDRADDPKTKAQARLLTARALHTAGSLEDAEAQFAEVFASATGREGMQEWGLSVLIASADLALSLGKATIARQNAEAAFEVIDQARQSAGSLHAYNTSNPANLIRVATLLQLTGSSDMAAVLFEKASSPSRKPEDRDRKAWRLKEFLISQLRLKDKDAADATLQELLSLGDGAPAWAVNEGLRDAGLALVDYGLLLDAQKIAEQLETLPYAGGMSYGINMALLAKDPMLAPALLPGIRSPYLHVEVSIAWAQTLYGSGQMAKSKKVFQSLVDDHAGRDDADYPLPSYRTQAMAQIAKAQDSLGFADEAASTRLRGLSFADKDMVPSLRVTALLSLAASFP
jgi:tetratricopeptide (TPR) repeat protein